MQVMYYATKDSDHESDLKSNLTLEYNNIFYIMYNTQVKKVFQVVHTLKQVQQHMVMVGI